MTQPSAPTGADDRLSFLTPDGSPLPYYMRPDLAFDDFFVVGPQNPGFAGFTLTVPGAFYDLPLEMYGLYNRDANAATVNAFLLIQDNAGNFIQRIGMQGAMSANGSYDILWSRSLSHIDVETGVGYASPMPNLWLPPGYKWGIQVQNNQPGDNMSRLTLVRRRMPTGPPLPQSAPTALNILDTSALV